ncbi:putative non-specific lipid-transfer protein AKCS9 [Cardamine amara subsp. amara]|uniref:Non-specific lipid-transfer protein AKCS9 n=1 Tax=Cardamine amara subsp. amara TaxID=228776 RepID=A0ABD1BDQ6_CARAN
MKMKIVSLVLIAFVILFTSFLVPTKAIGVGGSGSKRNGESCVVEDLQSCFDIIRSGSMMLSTCCEKLEEKKSCLCSYIKSPEYKRILSSRRGRVYLSSCGISYPSC